MKKVTNPYHMQEFKKVGLLEEKICLFPFLKHISSQDALQKIVELLAKISTAKYEPNIKYNILWDVILLGELIGSKLPEEITTGVTVKTLDLVGSPSKLCSDLTDQQQWCLFKLARNTAADGFHIMYEDKTRFFVGQVILLCQGNNVQETMPALNREITKISRGSNVAKILKGDKGAQTKMFEQAGYFLERARDFSFQENVQATCMALVSAGNCCRFIIRGMDESPAVRQLTELRSGIIHKATIDTSGSNLIKIVRSASGKLDELIVKLENEAKGLGLEVNVKGYVAKEKSAEEHESPRGYSKNL